MQTDKFCHIMYITEAFDYFASFIGHSFESWNLHPFYKFLKFMVKFWPISAPEHRTTKRKFWMIWWAIYYIWTVEIPRFRQFFAILPTKKNKKTKTILPPWLEKERVSLAGAARAPVQGDAQDGGMHAAGLGLHGAAAAAHPFAGEALVMVAAGTSHFCALTETGVVWVWDSNDFGHLGTRDDTDVNVPNHWYTKSCIYIYQILSNSYEIAWWNPHVQLPAHSHICTAHVRQTTNTCMSTQGG